VKTDPRDATTLCQRLSRYLDGFHDLGAAEIAALGDNLMQNRLSGRLRRSVWIGSGIKKERTSVGLRVAGSRFERSGFVDRAKIHLRASIKALLDEHKVADPSCIPYGLFG
jgi:hypothetical protein